MGPMFYLVQSHGALRPISAVILADWPHEFALALLLGKRKRLELGSVGLGARCAGRASPLPA